MPYTQHPGTKQEVLWEAEREARTDEEGHYQIESPETAARKRALAMESRRYLASKAERDRKRLCEANDDWNSSLGAEGSKGVVPVSGRCTGGNAGCARRFSHATRRNCSAAVLSHGHERWGELGACSVTSGSPDVLIPCAPPAHIEREDLAAYWLSPFRSRATYR